MFDQLFWFSLAVVPLICVPGPDMILCISQGSARGRRVVWSAVNGITLGYLAHAGLAAVGLAAVIAASPALFEIIRWLGIAYLVWIAATMLRSAVKPLATDPQDVRPISLWRGFLTSFLNPKGLFVYLALVPQFIDPTLGQPGLQAFMLSAFLHRAM